MPRKQKRYHYIYKTTNLINSKFYVGMHSTEDLNDEYLGSGTYLRRSIRKYGNENFKLEILEFFESRDELVEIELVNESLLKDPLCMNLKLGGRGGWTIEQQKKNAFISHKKQRELRKSDLIWSSKVSKNMSNAQIEAYKKGRKVVTPDWTGLKHTEESKDKMRQKAKLRIKDKNSQFETCWIYNKKLKINKKIKNKELKKYLDINWIKGRKIKW